MDLDERLARIGLTRMYFADLTGLNRATVYGWGKVRGGRMQYVPVWADLLIEAWECHPSLLDHLLADG